MTLKFIKQKKNYLKLDQFNYELCLYTLLPLINYLAWRHASLCSIIFFFCVG